MLVSEGQNFQEIQFEQLKISMEKELMRRASYYFYMGKVKDFSSSLKDHYQARRANIIFRERNQSLNKFDDYGWDWLDKEGVLTLKGTNCIQDFCLDVEIPWTRTWLIESCSSLVSELSEMRLLGWSAVLESSDLDIPKIVREYFLMSDELNGLEIGSQKFYGSRFGPSKFNLHRLTVVDVEESRVKVFEQFIGWFWLVVSLLALTYLIRHYWHYQLSSTYRILMGILLIITLPSIFLSFQSKALIKQQEKQRRHQREIEVINRNALSIVKPSYDKVRHLLPFQDGGIYHLEIEDGLLLFTATSGQLRGKYYTNLKGNKIKELLILLLLICISIFAYILLFRDSEKFWSHLYSRLEKQIGNNYSWWNLEVPSVKEIYNHWDIWRLQLEAEKNIQRRTLQQRILSYEFDKSSVVGIDSKTVFPQELQGVVVSVAPSRPRQLEGQAARDYFEDLNSFLEIFRKTCVKYGGIPFQDAHWHQKAIFSLPQDFLSGQRAILFGLDFVKRLRELDLPLGVSYYGIAMQGSITLTKIGKSFTNEIVVTGAVLKQCDEAIQLLNDSNGFWIHDELAVQSIKRSFEMGFRKFDEWNHVSGVKNVEDHLNLLDFPSSELQRTALELLSFRTDQAILDKVLEKIPSLEPEIMDQSVEIICDYLNDKYSRSKIFEKILTWSKQGHEESSLKILSIFHKRSLVLTLDEIDCLMKLSTPIYQEVVLSLILKNSYHEYFDELDSRIKYSSITIRCRWAFIKFKKKPSEKYLTELCDYLTESNDKFLLEILKVWSEVEVDLESSMGKCFNTWFQQNNEYLVARILELVESDNMPIKLKSLRVISHLKLSDLESELVRIYNLSRESEFKSEIIFTLQNLGSSSYLLQNLI